eukprot:CAMPEP_0170297430 /NCGR_PEP_ID=MMETSP0116_2-20130129/48875_1 /TAXON_ID=400756 /ORGANISM="Durinskia baltica, Strain CSIRO CS-38" /LENGTH=78 /DNA_ID=CAMNT_0010549053 /DNA_START=28 /DNA_END=262 /DNA_ORIENTATION=-
MPAAAARLPAGANQLKPGVAIKLWSTAITAYCCAGLFSATAAITARTMGSGRLLSAACHGGGSQRALKEVLEASPSAA